MSALLIVLSGLPGTGKTKLARAAALALGAIHLRIDSIEQAILRSSLAPSSVEEAGYLAAYAVALDNLRLGRIVIADSVNPIELTRQGWRRAAADAGVAALDIEVICSDRALHRQRVEARVPDIQGMHLPSWDDVVARHYEAWTSERLVLDMGRFPIDACVARLKSALPP